MVTFGGGGGVTGGGHAWSSGMFQCFSSPPGWLCMCLHACMFVCVIYFLQLGVGGRKENQWVLLKARPMALVPESSMLLTSCPGQSRTDSS